MDSKHILSKEMATTVEGNFCLIREKNQEKTTLFSLHVNVHITAYVEMLSHSLHACFIIEAIPIPADQPIMQIKDLDEVVIPTMEIKVKKIIGLLTFLLSLISSVWKI